MALHKIEAGGLVIYAGDDGLRKFHEAVLKASEHYKHIPIKWEKDPKDFPRYIAGVDPISPDAKSSIGGIIYSQEYMKKMVVEHLGIPADRQGLAEEDFDYAKNPYK